MASYLTSRELASRLRVKIITVVRWRQRGIGPPFVKAGKSIRYNIEDVERWEEEHRRL